MDVVRVAFLQGCGGNLDESAVFLQFLDSLGSAVAHTGTEASHQLEYGVFHSAFIGYAAFHAFGYEFLGIILEITVFASVFHGGDGAHAAVYFIFTSLIQFKGSRAFVAACEDTSHHADIAACCNGLCHISGILDAAVRNNRNPIFLGNRIAVHDCRYLRYADTCNYTGGTDRTGPDTYLNRICAGFNQIPGALACCHVACDNLQVRIFFLNHAQTSEHVFGMSVGGIKNNHIHLCIHKSAHTVQNIGSNAYACTAEKAALGILC